MNLEPAQTTTKSVAPCAMCAAEPRDEISHIIPAFVYRWLKQSSPTGFIRAAGNPNKRLQDGPKQHLLGRTCEDLFSGWENQFAETIFREVHHEGINNLNFSYGDWFAKFCVGTSWRSLAYLLESKSDVTLPFGHEEAAHAALGKWRAFLKGETRFIDPHWQYFLILDTPISVPNEADRADMTTFIHRSVDIDTMHAPGECYIFTKMCNVLIIGSIVDTNPKQWQRCKVGLSGGNYRCPEDFRVSGCFTKYFETALDQLRQARRETSPAQVAKMTATLRQRHMRSP